jgi:dTDP-4-amino-4,6-dideoxygalactose transaminase
VDFVDVDEVSGNMSVEALARKLEDANERGLLPKAVIPVHLTGMSCDMRSIGELADQFGFRIIEDASHAIGGRYAESPVGSCEFSDVTVFSFHPVKIITTGEGGLAVTNDEQLARTMALLRSHGVTRDPSEMSHEPDGPWYYEQVALGFNYRMTELQAALGVSQMARLDDFVLRRHELADWYDDHLGELPVELPVRRPESYSSLHLYIVHLKLDDCATSHLDVFTSMRAHGIGVNLHYIPVYLHPYYAELGFLPGHCPHAERVYARSISIPMHAGLTEADQTAVADALTVACG